MVGTAASGSLVQGLTITDESSELKASDLEAIALLYDQIRFVRRKVEHDGDKKLAEDFDLHLKSVMADLSSSLQEIQHISELNTIQEDKKQAFQTSVDSMKKRVILATKKALVSICQEKALEYL